MADMEITKITEERFNVPIEGLVVAAVADWLAANPPSGVELPPGFIQGLTLSNNTGNAAKDIDIAAGKARDGDNLADLVLASALTKRLDDPWVEGSGQGGLDAGSVADGSYHLFLIGRSDTGASDAIFSASPSAPTLPAGYDRKRRIGSVVRSNGVIRPFVQNVDEFLWKENAVDANGVTSPTSAADVVLTVPTGIEVNALATLRVDYISAATTVLVTSKHQNDQPATSQNQTTVVSSGSTPNGANLNLRTDTAGRIRIRATSNGAQYIVTTIGYIDRRGRD